VQHRAYEGPAAEVRMDRKVKQRALLARVRMVEGIGVDFVIDARVEALYSIVDEFRPGDCDNRAGRRLERRGARKVRGVLPSDQLSNRTLTMMAMRLSLGQR
jgi:hypothetical protein